MISHNSSRLTAHTEISKTELKKRAKAREKEATKAAKAPPTQQTSSKAKSAEEDEGSLSAHACRRYTIREDRLLTLYSNISSSARGPYISLGRPRILTLILINSR